MKFPQPILLLLTMSALLTGALVLMNLDGGEQALPKEESLVELPQWSGPSAQPKKDEGPIEPAPAYPQNAAVPEGAQASAPEQAPPVSPQAEDPEAKDNKIRKKSTGIHQAAAQTIRDMRNSRLQFMNQQNKVQDTSTSDDEASEDDGDSDSEAGDDEDEDEEEIERHTLTVRVVMEGRAAAGLPLHWSNDVGLPETGADWPQGQWMVNTDPQGMARIRLEDGVSGSLLLPSAVGAEVVYRGRLDDDIDMVYEVKYPTEPLATVSGFVSDPSGEAAPGAHVANRAIANAEQHLAALQDASYRFGQSGPDGRFIIARFPVGESVELFVSNLETGEVVSRELGALEAEVVTDTGVWVLETMAPEPASWTATIVDTDEVAIPGVVLSTRSFTDINEALIFSEDLVYSDDLGQVVLSDLTAGESLSLYAYDETLGAVLLETKTFEEGEVYRAVYPLNIGGDKPGQVGIRLQSTEGYDVRQGYFSFEYFEGVENVEAAVERSEAFVLVPGTTTWLTGVEANLNQSLYYITAKGQPVYLREVLISSGEKKDLGSLRLQDDSLLDAYLFGQILTREGQVVSGLTLDLTWGSSESLRVRVDDMGNYAFEGIPQNQRLSIVAEDAQARRSILLSEWLMSDLQVQKDLVWEEMVDVDFEVKGENGEPVQDARVSVVPFEEDALAWANASPPRHLNLPTDENGKLKVEGILPGWTYRVSVSHPFYENLDSQDWVLKQGDTDSVELELKAARGVKVKLNGPDFEEGFHVRAWIGVSREGIIAPDYKPGNEYGEILTDTHMIFGTPPDESFWIYVGGLDSPWGNGLHGPFPRNSEFLEIDLVQVNPLRVDISKNNFNHQTWNCLIYRYDDRAKSIGQIKGEQVMRPGTQTSDIYLHPGSYLVRAQAPHFHKKVEEVDVREEGGVVELRLDARDSEPKDTGWFTSYVVSDTFPLVLSDRNEHHEEMYYGFNVDLLSHLGGEAHYKALHLGTHPSLNGDRTINWRRVDLEQDGYTINFKGSQLFPGDAGNYVTIYAQTEVISPSTRQAVLGVTTDDGFKAWVNGSLVGQVNIARPIYFRNGQRGDADRMEVLLRPGSNRIHFKVTNSWGHFALGARLLDASTLQPMEDITVVGTVVED